MVIAVNSFNISYMAVPKAACSTVKAMLAQVDPEVTLPPHDQITNRTYHAAYPTVRFRPHRWEKRKNSYWFTVVRDPVKRLMSLYTNRVIEKRELRNCRKIRSGRVSLPVDPDPDFFFQNLQAYIGAASVIKHHALPTWLFTGRDLGRYDRVFRTSELDELANEISERTRTPVSAIQANKSALTLDFQGLRPETRDALRTFLRDEYAFLKDYYTPTFC